MIRLAAIVFAIIITAPAAFAASEIYPGVYKLKGANSEGSQSYEGRLTIQQEGANYRVRWFIGPVQSQTGVGIVESGVLSIGYQDDSGQDLGVVSMRLNGKNMKGKWASMYSKGKFGTEEYTFESDKIPGELLAKPLKK